ncbi:MAG: hypothetical protein O7F76_02155 [Planctomycetota bacterium]|nr:hypothetical protein [Planctomycetota bacterium]
MSVSQQFITILIEGLINTVGSIIVSIIGDLFNAILATLLGT